VVDVQLLSDTDPTTGEYRDGCPGYTVEEIQDRVVTRGDQQYRVGGPGFWFCVAPREITLPNAV
jgi:hypothetical protein